MPSCVQDFVRHYRRFMEQNRDFDQRLGTVLNLAFQHSKNLKSTFKVCLLHPDSLNNPTHKVLISCTFSVAENVYHGSYYSHIDLRLD